MGFPFLRHLFRSVAARRIVLAGLLAAPGKMGAAASDVVPQFSQRSWSRADGLPSNEVTGLCLDRTGYLWIATSAGVARFDGSRFLTCGPVAGESPRAGGVAAIAADPASDEVWAAPDTGGVIRLRQGRFERVALPDGYAQRRVARLFFGADHALWIGLEGGEVLRRHGEAYEAFGERDGLGPRRSTLFASDGAGRVWLANGPRLARYEAGELHPFQLEGVTENVRIASARLDGPWVLTRGWLRKVVGDRLPVKIEVNNGYNAASVQAILEDSSGAVWTGTRARGVRRLTLPEQKSDLVIGNPEDVGALAEDPAGNIWAGSYGGGLVRVRPGAVRLIDKSLGLLESHTLSVCEGSEGTLWIANRDGGVAFVNGLGRVQTLASPRVRETFVARSVVPAPPDGIWVTTSHGLFRAHPPGLSPFEAAEAALPDHGSMRVMHRARNGDLWIALAPQHLGRLRDGVWRVYAEADGLATGSVLAVAEDASGRIWIGTEETALQRLDGERFVTVPLAPSLRSGAIQAIHFDGAGAGWIGTAGAGLLRLDAAVARNLDDLHGLPTRNLAQVISDDEGLLWFGSPEGIFHVRRDELERFFDGRISRVDAVVLGADAGLKEAPSASGHQPSVWKSRDGLLWFATRQGVVAIDPRREHASATPLLVKIDTVRSNAGSWPGDAPVRVPALNRTLELDYSVLCLSTPDRVRVRVRLEGYDDDWAATAARGLARYSRLPPGTYRFRVEASVAGVPGTEAQAGVSIVVAAAWWQTWWCRAGAVLLAVLLGIGVVRSWFHRRLRARLAQLEHASALERERARIAQNIHDDLGSGLTRISLLTQTAEPGEGRAQLEKIFRTVGGLTRSMDEIVWAVNPKNDNLENFANYLVEFAQGYLTDAQIRCRVLLPELLPARTLPAQCRHHLFLSCKEALNNVVKHAHASAVALQLRVEAERLVLVVSDNGRGFGEPVSADAPRRPGAPNGLANMRARLDALGGSCDIVSSAAGTVVTFSAPLSSPSVSP